MRPASYIVAILGLITACVASFVDGASEAELKQILLQGGLGLLGVGSAGVALTHDPRARGEQQSGIEQ